MIRVVHQNVHNHKYHLPQTHPRSISDPPNTPVRTYCWCGYCVEETND